MRSSKCMFSTAVALHRVFIAPIEHSQYQFVRRPILVSPIQAHSHAINQRRPMLVFDRKAEKNRLPRDEEIQASSVTVVDEHGALKEFQSIKSVLASIDRKIYSLVTVVEGQPGVPPICKIMNKQVMRDAEKKQDKAKRKAASGKTGKTIELNWAIGNNDLEHRMKRIKEFLSKGMKVDVICAKKRKGKPVTEEECEEVIRRIRLAVEEVPGTKEKPMEGKILEEVKLHFIGPKQKTKSPSKDMELDEDEDEDEADTAS